MYRRRTALRHYTQASIARWILLLLFLLFALSAPHAQQAEKAALVIQTGHTGPVTSVAVSPDGRFIVSGSLDTTVKLWNRETGQQLRSFEGLILQVRSVALSPDGTMVAGGDIQGTVKVWNVETGELLRTMASERQDSFQWVHAVVFSPDGATLAFSKANDQIEIWNYRTGELRFRLSHPRLKPDSIVFSPDGKSLVSGGAYFLRMLDPVKGVQVREIPESHYSIKVVRFFPDGKTLVSGHQDGSIRTWNAETGETLVDFDKAPSEIRSISVSPDGGTVAGHGKEPIIRLWNAKTGKEKKQIPVEGIQLNAVEFAGDSNVLATANADGAVRLWNAENGSHIRSFVGHSSWVHSAAVSPDGKTAASGNADGTLRLWNLTSGNILRVLKHESAPGMPPGVGRVAFSLDGKLIATANADKSIAVWRFDDGTPIRRLSGHTQVPLAIAFSPDGKKLASGGSDETVRIWDVEAGRQEALIGGVQGELFKGRGMFKGIYDLDFTPDGKMLAVGSASKFVTLWDPTSGKLIESFDEQKDAVLSVDFSPDGKTLASLGIGARTIKFWDIASGTVKRSIQLAPRDTVINLDFSPDGRLLAGAGVNAVLLWDENNKEPIQRLVGHATGVASVAFTPDGKFLVTAGGQDSTMRIWPLERDGTAATVTAIDKDDWVVTTSNGLFDASPSARKLMHYVLGLEAVSLDQMKDTYFVPGLFRNVYRGDPLPRVQLFTSRDLFPNVEFAQPKPGQTVLPVKLTNRGGGIGQVQVLVNGKEIISDARSVNFDPGIKEAKLNISLLNAPFIGGRENKIEIIARNAAGSLSNKGTPRADQFVTVAETPQRATPNIYIIAGGISSYTGDQLNLNFAAKDAEDFAKAVEIGAIKLLKGDKSKVRVRLLTSNGTNSNVKFDVPDAKVSTATKADFERAFADFKGATSNDVFIVYLAGHGISLNTNQKAGQSGNMYLYLTQEATSADRAVLSVEGVRKAMTVSGDEIKEMMKQNKALKQVLILDTCAAGAASSSFVAKRDVPSDQIGALERLKDNTGFYILMGSAADRVSYEASQFAQGLLTYSLLQGMKGAMLRDDQYADVEMLFGYAKNTVGQLAKNIGGVQRPETITPDVSRSFDIGQFTAAEQSQITLSSPIPLVLRPRLTNPKLRFDNLGLEKIFRTELRAASFVAARGDKAKIVFVESDEMPDAVLPSGDYTVDGEDLTITLVFVKNGRPFGKEITVTGKTAEKEILIRRLVQAIAGSN